MKESTYDKIILNDHPVGYWPLDETSGTVAHDLSGYGNDGIIQGGVTLGQPSPFFSGDTMMKFDGSSGYIQTPLEQINAVSRSLEIWVNTTVAGDNKPLITDRGDGTGLSITLTMPGFGISGGAIGIGCDSNDVFIGINSSLNYNNGLLHHAVGVWTGQPGVSVTPSQFQVFVDGNLVSTVSANAGSVTAPLTGNGGTQIAYDASWGYFSGILAKAAVYNYPLTPQRIAYHYKAGLTHL